MKDWWVTGSSLSSLKVRNTPIFNEWSHEQYLPRGTGKVMTDRRTTEDSRSPQSLDTLVSTEVLTCGVVQNKKVRSQGLFEWKQEGRKSYAENNVERDKGPKYQSGSPLFVPFGSDMVQQVWCTEEVEGDLSFFIV